MVRVGCGAREPRPQGPLGACRPAGGGSARRQRQQRLASWDLLHDSSYQLRRPIWIAQRRTASD